MKRGFGKHLVFSILFFCSINTAYSQVNAEHRNQQSAGTYKQTLFHEAAPKYVKVLEQQYARKGVFGLLLDEVDALIARIPSEGATQELANEYLTLINKTEMKVANKLTLSVFDLPEFYHFFRANTASYISSDSPLYDKFVKNIGTSYIETIRVNCNHDYCNNPTHALMRVAIAGEFAIHNIAHGDIAYVEVVNDNNQLYSNTSGIWRSNDSGGVELLEGTTRPCDTCEIN